MTQRRLLLSLLLTYVGIGQQHATTTIVNAQQTQTAASNHICGDIRSSRAKVLEQRRHVTTSSQSCAESCRDNGSCNAWFWCREEQRPCWDRQSQTQVQPQWCLLLHTSLAPGVPPTAEDAEAPFTSFAAGFFVDTEHRYLKYGAPPQLIMASVVRRCEGQPGAEEANRLNWASVQNKLDFAHLHGFEFWLVAERGERDKVDVLQQVLDEAPHDAWLLWVDFDTVFANRAFTFPFRQYEEEGRHVVLSGMLNEVLEGNGYQADTGTLLLRNTHWTRALYKLIRSMVDDVDTVAAMTSGLKHYHEEYAGRNDRTTLVWLVHRQPEVYLPQVKFESRYCMACFWLGQDPAQSFITHFLMTEKCNQFSLARNTTYNRLFWQHYELSRCTFVQGVVAQAQPLAVLAAAHRRSAAGFKPLRLGASHPELGRPQVVVAAREHRVGSANACRAACRAAAYCNMWLYCWHPGGCDAGRGGPAARRRLPERGCQLLHLQPDQPFDLLAHGPLYSSFSIGFFTPAEHHRNRRQKQKKKQKTAQHRRQRLSQPTSMPVGGAEADHVQSSQRSQKQRQASANVQRSLHQDSQSQQQQLSHQQSWLQQPDEPQQRQRGQRYKQQSDQQQQQQQQLAIQQRQQQAQQQSQQSNVAAVQQAAEASAESAAAGIDGITADGRANVALLTAVPPTPCKAPLADLINSLSLANKVDYARVQGYELHFSTSNVKANATGVFNKESMITKMLREATVQEAAWLFWVDIDTVMVNVSAPLPLHNYAGRDFVAWGHSERLKEGDMMQGINNGVLLVRNSDWSRKFWGEVTAHATTEGLAQWKGRLEAELGKLPTGFFDTPIIVYLLKTRAEYYERVFFERGSLGFNRHWLSVNWTAAEEPLVVHYAGCTYCSPPTDVISEERVTECNTGFARAYALSKCLLQRHFLGDARACVYNEVNVADIA